MEIPSPDEKWMKVALDLAREAATKEEVPVGALLTRGEEIIAANYNQVETKKDALAHAELLVLAEAQKKLGDWRLTDCTLYVTKEPCLMCAGAIIHTRLKRVVFGVSDPKAGGMGGAVNLVQLPGVNHRCECTSGIAEMEARALLQDFFRKRRQDNEINPSAEKD